MGKTVDHVGPGELVTIKLHVADESKVDIGNFLTLRHSDHPIPISSEFKVEIELLKDASATHQPKIISNGFKCIMHMGAFAHEVILEDLTRCETLQEDQTLVIHHKPRFVTSPSRVWCKISCKDAPTALHKYESFVLRFIDDNYTFGIGKILKYKPYPLPQLPEPVNSDQYLQQKRTEQRKKVR